MFYAYVLESKKDGKFYYGSTENIESRVARHNAGRVASTKYRLPMVLIGYITFRTRTEAERQEKYFKKCRNRDYIMRLLRQYGAIV